MLFIHEMIFKFKIEKRKKNTQNKNSGTRFFFSINNKVNSKNAKKDAIK